MTKPIAEFKTRNGTTWFLFLSRWYFGVKIIGPGVRWRGWVWGWYRHGLLGQFAPNFGKWDLERIE